MKSITFFLSLSPLICLSQKELPRIDKDTLLTTIGYNIGEGQDVKLGTGTLPNGDFKFITMSSTSWVALNNPTSRPDPVGRKWSGHLFKVKKFRKEGTKKRGYVLYLILGGGNLVNYECDVENAIASGEIIVPDIYKPKPSAQGTAGSSMADELKKLKDLYDTQAITKDEYDSAKKKILAKY